MICIQCGEKLICRMSNYKHPYTNKLQWQNQDGTAHFKFNSGKKSKDLKKALTEQEDFMKEAELSKGDQF